MGEHAEGEPLFSDEAHREAASRVERVVNEFCEEAAGKPTLEEFLEILGASVPVNNESIDVHQLPMRLRAELVGNRRYTSSRGSRVGDLNDAVFVEASDWLSLLAEHVVAASGHPASADDLAAGILRTLRNSGIAFADVDGSDLLSLSVEVPKGRARPERGDVVAISTKKGGYHLAVVLGRNRFGTALGFLRGVFSFPRVEDADRCQARPYPVYTDDQLIADGTWRIVGRNEGLLPLFPSDPEIYHGPDLLWPDVQVGKYGSAESAAGVLRQISRDEAQEVGLLDGSYRQAVVSQHLHQILDEES